MYIQPINEPTVIVPYDPATRVPQYPFERIPYIPMRLPTPAGMPTYPMVCPGRGPGDLFPYRAPEYVLN